MCYCDYSVWAAGYLYGPMFLKRLDFCGCMAGRWSRRSSSRQAPVFGCGAISRKGETACKDPAEAKLSSI